MNASATRQWKRNLRIEGGRFVFFNRRRDRVKLLYWHLDGYALWAKPLESGNFQIPSLDASAREATLSATDLSLILQGIDLTSVKCRQRYQRTAD